MSRKRRMKGKEEDRRRSKRGRKGGVEEGGE